MISDNPAKKVNVTDTPKNIEGKAHELWGGWRGYECGECGYSVYGKSEDWCHAHLLEHLVEKLRAK